MDAPNDGDSDLINEFKNVVRLECTLDDGYYGYFGDDDAKYVYKPDCNWEWHKHMAINEYDDSLTVTIDGLDVPSDFESVGGYPDCGAGGQ